jgi:hypothetical protein
MLSSTDFDYEFVFSRVNEINRYLVDHACGTTASQMPHFFPPNFKLENCGEKLQKVWPQILEEIKRR